MWNQPTNDLEAWNSNPTQQQDPGFWQRLQQNGVLGMPVSEAMLRFGSGLLSGDSWEQGLSRGGASLVQGMGAAQQRQTQEQMMQRRFQEAQILQNQRIASAERIARDRVAAGEAGLAGERLLDPVTQTLYHSDRGQVYPLGSRTPLDRSNPEHAAILDRLGRAPQIVTTGDQRLQATNVERYNELVRQGNDARSFLADVDTARALLNPAEGVTLDTGSTIPSRLIRGFVELTGIPWGANRAETLQQLQIYLGGLNAQQRAALLEGLAPVSNAEFQSADRALASVATDPRALNLLLDMQRRRLVQRIEVGDALSGTSPGAISRDGFTVDSWLTRWNNTNRPVNTNQGQSRVVPAPTDPPGTTGTGTPSPNPVPGQGGSQTQQGTPAPGTPAPAAPVVQSSQGNIGFRVRGQGSAQEAPAQAPPPAQPDQAQLPVVRPIPRASVERALTGAVSEVRAIRGTPTDAQIIAIAQQYGVTADALRAALQARGR